MDNIKTLEITRDVHWVGVLDPDLVSFDVVMETKYGTTYNSYLILAEKCAVVETVKEGFSNEFIAKISALMDPARLEYIILDHTEPDHSGALANLLKVAPNAKVVGSGNAIRYLKDLFEIQFESIIVKDGDTLDLGNKTLKFIAAPNLHWPDSMYTYLAEDRLLFTCDSFGAHYSDGRLFNDLVDDYYDSFKYYFDVILKPFSKFMLKAIDKIKPLDIQAICPGHGPILRSDWQQWVNVSARLAREALTETSTARVFIPYVSAYNKTKKVALKIAEGISSAGNFETDVCDIETMSAGDLEERIARSSGLVLGSPTINQNILLPVYKCFALINPIRDKGKLAGAFGSYGWSGESRKIIESNLRNLKLNFFGEGVFVKFTPNSNELDEAFEYGKKFGEALLTNTISAE